MDAYKDNLGTIYVWRSARRNAALLKGINVYHLISHDQQGKCSDERILAHFVSTVSEIFAAAEMEFYISVSMSESRVCINHESGKEATQAWFWRTEKMDFCHPREMIHWIWFNFFCRIYPYNRIDFTTIEMNPSIQHFINEWEGKTSGGDPQ